MAKKVVFIILFVLFFAAGSVVCLATGEIEDYYGFSSDVALFEEFDEPAIDTAIEEPDSEEGPYDAILQEYSVVFFDKESVSDTVFVDVKVNQDTVKESIQDYKVTAMVADSVELEAEDAIVLMLFVEKDDEFVLLADPQETIWLYLAQVVMPFTGEDHPNHIRLVAFRKNSEVLALNENLQITDMQITVKEPEDNAFSKIDVRDALKKLFNIK